MTMIDLTDVEYVKKEIARAREFARWHFNAEEAEEPLFTVGENGEMQLKKPSFFVEFPEPDEMIVVPSVVGKKGTFEIAYRLVFKNDGRLLWRSLEWGGNLSDLEVLPEVLWKQQGE